MSTPDIVLGAALVAMLTIYLIVALIRPERF
jgi:K+-transporting ATPase KdpF subunit